MLRRRGFTLIELLVVVAIIALLIAILLPSLSRARKQAKEVLCQSNLKQWGNIWQMYTQDNDDSFSEGLIDDGGWHRGEWITVLRPFWATRDGIIRCPLATKRIAGANHGGAFNTYWMPVGGSGDPNLGGEEPSYGANNWIYNPRPEVEKIQQRPTEYT